VVNIIDRPECVQPPASKCSCGGPMPMPAFDPNDANAPADVVRRRWPRLDWRCERCGTRSIIYASFAHFIAGDW